MLVGPMTMLASWNLPLVCRRIGWQRYYQMLSTVPDSGQRVPDGWCVHGRVTLPTHVDTPFLYCRITSIDEKSNFLSMNRPSTADGNVTGLKSAINYPNSQKGRELNVPAINHSILLRNGVSGGFEPPRFIALLPSQRRDGGD